MKKVTLLLLILVISGCDKNRNNQYSIWYVNGKEFKTNDVSVEQSKAMTILTTKNQSNGFRLTFEKGSFTTSGLIYLKCMTPNPMFGCFSIYYSGKAYLPKDSAFLTASLMSGKASYQLDECWFYHALSYTEFSPEGDSILVKGVFKEP